jgi:hypothetical protein
MPNPTNKRKPSAKKAESTAITVPANKFIAPPAGATSALAPHAPAAGDIERQGDAVRVTGHTYKAGDLPLEEATVFFVGRKHRDKGPSRGEADKVAWQDPVTGYECIIMRDPKLGHLRGFVGVPPEHPLFGFKHGAIPLSLGIEVHGGLTYSAPCDLTASRHVLEREAHRVCHVTRVWKKETYATSHRPRDDAWWFGFDCNLPNDLQPYVIRRLDYNGPRQTYRDDEYVANEVLNLAAQLKAIEQGLPMPPRLGPPLPPIGMNEAPGRSRKGRI